MLPSFFFSVHQPEAKVNHPDYKVIGKPLPETKVTLYFGVKQQNKVYTSFFVPAGTSAPTLIIYFIRFFLFFFRAPQEKLEALFWAVSDPKNKQMYGKYLSNQQVTDLVASNPRDMQTVVSWLRMHGVTSYEITAHKDMIVAPMAVTTAEKLLDIELFIFQHKERSDVQLIRAKHAGYTVPANVAPALDMVEGVHRLPNVYNTPSMNEAKKSPEAVPGSWSNSCGVGCQGRVTPAVLEQAYDIKNPAKGNATQSVAEFPGPVLLAHGLEQVLDPVLDH